MRTNTFAGLISPFLCFLFVFSIKDVARAQAPNFLWAKSMGGPSASSGTSVVLDNFDNVYTLGSFWGSVDFDPGPGTYNLGYNGKLSIFISKLDKDGNFIWAKAIGGPNGNGGGSSIAIDAFGNLYITGSFTDQIDFDPGIGTYNLTVDSNYYQDLFISKIDTAGNFIWAKKIGGNSWDQGYSILVDPLGTDIYLAGNVSGSSPIDVDPDTSVFYITIPGGGALIAKFDSTCKLVWAKAIGGNPGIAIATSVTIDPSGSGDLYLTGQFGSNGLTGNGHDTIDFDPGPGVYNLISIFDFDIFILKLDNSGNFIWARSMDGYDGEYGQSIAYDPSGTGGVYITGQFRDMVDFDPGPGIFNLYLGTNRNIFIAKLDGSGNFLWAHAFGGTSYDCQGRSISLDGTGNVYITGRFEGTVDFDPGPNTFNLSSGQIFILKLDGLGNFIWATNETYLSGSGENVGLSLVLNGAGNIFVTGFFNQNMIAFGSTILTNSVNNGSVSNIFIAKLDNVTTGIDAPDMVIQSAIYPNPASNYISISLPVDHKPSRIYISDVTGKIIYECIANQSQLTKINSMEFSSGMYFVQIKTSDRIETQKLIVAK